MTPDEITPIDDHLLGELLAADAAMADSTGSDAREPCESSRARRGSDDPEGRESPPDLRAIPARAAEVYS
jgi:hypothetical protein